MDLKLEERALSFLRDALASGCFLKQFLGLEMCRGIQKLTSLHYPYSCVPHTMLQQYRQQVEGCCFSSRSCCSVAISLEARAVIAFPVFESDHDLFCCAVLELVITEEKLDFDLEIEKVFLARSLCRSKEGNPGSSLISSNA
ncbi:hypothetical protein SADUNF_Sadunf17G0012400 [Salix dunnii]|uniref:Uncharacterized protein n=1 Tax=Salix dunnii TaxID=1413687 RepID=A0A835J701_9ROSI|nr:hypothetical protein SADUNF_Sadunf17G0012400 [Salix dunnii]